jgi:hypothetical protein
MWPDRRFSVHEMEDSALIEAAQRGDNTPSSGGFAATSIGRRTDRDAAVR